MNADSAVTTAGFWLATVLPVAYLPVFATGVDTPGRLTLILVLLAINVVALVVGHEYPATRS